jgi:hypothetical protein
VNSKKQQRVTYKRPSPSPMSRPPLPLFRNLSSLVLTKSANPDSAVPRLTSQKVKVKSRSTALKVKTFHLSSAINKSVCFLGQNEENAAN